MAVDIAGLVTVIVLYLVILVFGILVARWFDKHKLQNVSEEERLMVAGRKIGITVGIFTMTGGNFKAKLSLPVFYKYIVNKNLC